MNDFLFLNTVNCLDVRNQGNSILFWLKAILTIKSSGDQGFCTELDFLKSLCLIISVLSLIPSDVAKHLCLMTLKNSREQEIKVLKHSEIC